MSSINQIAAEKANAIEQLTFDEELKTSQWLRAAPFETVFCVAVKARTAESVGAEQLLDATRPGTRSCSLMHT